MEFFGECIDVVNKDMQVEAIDNSLPRMKFSSFCKISFYNGKKMWKVARQLTDELGQLNIDPDRIIRWMEALEMDEELKRFRANRDVYIQSWEREISNKSLTCDDGMVHDLECRSGSDVAKMRPQMDGTDDSNKVEMSKNNVALAPGTFGTIPHRV